MSTNIRLLAIEPYFDGSHRFFLEGMGRHCRLDMDLLTLPAHSWKWRMRFAAPYFASCLADGGVYDTLFCSSMLDVAAFRGLGLSWLRTANLITYFHENQFVYPSQRGDERDLHFAVTNLTTALASDKVIFNSKFNRDSFFRGAEEMIRRMPDMKSGIDLSAVRRKTEVLAPAIDFADIDASRTAGHSESTADGVPLIIWNHRWEHDKNPARFFAVLQGLQDRKIPFRLALFGQSFRNTPADFAVAKNRFKKEIVYFGFAPRDIYCNFLQQGTVVVSTALHEFYGMAVMEAVRAGCRPLLPQRLSYPELFPSAYLYEEEELEEKLIQFLEGGRLSDEEAIRLTEKGSWLSLAPSFRRLFMAR